MTKYREILRLSSLGFSNRNIALSVPCSRNTVSKVLKRAKELNLSWPLSDDQTDAVLEQLLYPKLHNRSNRRMPDYDYIRKELLRNGVSKKYDLHLREDDIDNLIKNRTLPSNLAAIQTKVLDTLDTMALQYLKRGIKTFIEDKIDLKMYTSVFVGGASLIFKPYILQLQEEGLLGKVIFIEDVHANAKGAQILYKSAKSLMNK